MSAFPPSRILPSLPITQDVALKHLQSYLTRSESTPYLLPNARLEQSGPAAGSSSASVTMYNLQRVEAGLRGVWLETGIGEGEDVPVAGGLDDGVVADEDVFDEAMDAETWQRNQKIELGGAARTIVEKGDTAKIEVPEIAVAQTKTSRVAAPDKDTRKAEKKARHKEEQKRKEEERKRLAEQ